ncbi:sodium-dependent transporter [Thermococcus zilligii]|uniref:sodium-dependent transporter n=1 Tax=Thermococcus zilligii TaxID=54076 RepID=UPI00029B4D1A|nr:sodium-dependent transporter [Thermococcus zilligii]
MDRLSFGYLSLVVAAFMIGLGNIWKFPALLLRYGLGGLVVYLLSVAIIVPLIAVALESTKHKRYEILEYYFKEYGRPAFALLFLVFDLLLISYYTIVGGWTISSLFIKDVTGSLTGNLVTLVIVFVILILILMRGKEKTLDVMVVSVVLFFLALVVSELSMYLNVPNKTAIGETLSKAFTWRGITLGMIKDMVIQAAYSLSLGMGFYLVLGEFLPEKVSGMKLAAAGAVLDTTASLIATVSISTVLAVDPTIPIEGTALLFKGLPKAMLEVLNLPVLLYLLSFAAFLAALSSMIPVGETIVRVYSNLTRIPREKSVPFMLGLGLVLGVVNVLGMSLGVDTITILDSAVSTFTLFGGIVAAWAIIERREYLQESVRKAAYSGILTVAVLGLYSLYTMLRTKQYASFLLLVGVVVIVLGINGKLKSHLESR